MSKSDADPSAQAHHKFDFMSPDQFTQTDLQPHDLALAFPDMNSASFDDLVEDIRQRGVIHPVVLHEGQILDGLHRWKACRQLGIECPTSIYDGSDPVGFVVSVNLRRRHLSTTQRAVIAAELVATERGTNQHAQNCGPSVEQAAKLLEVSPRSVTTAKTILRDATPEIKSAIKDGMIKLGSAEKMLRESRQQQEPQPPPRRRRTPPPSTVQIDYGEQIAIQTINMVAQLRDDDKSALAGLHQIREYINKRLGNTPHLTPSPSTLTTETGTDRPWATVSAYIKNITDGMPNAREREAVIRSTILSLINQTDELTDSKLRKHLFTLVRNEASHRLRRFRKPGKSNKEGRP